MKSHYLIIPDSLSMAGNMLTTLKLNKVGFSGKLESFKLSIMSNIWLVSLSAYDETR